MTDSGTGLLARREREALCDVALEVGPSAPTLCEGWTAQDLVAHLVVREREPWTSVGLVVPALSGLPERAMARAAREPYERLVGRVRDPGRTPWQFVWTLPPVERLANTLEYFVHHEDLRRGRVGWEPRTLPAADEAELWRLVRRAGRLLLRRAGVPVVARTPDGSRSATLRGGADPVTVTGPVGELVLFLFGRTEVRDVALEGPRERVSRLRSGSLGI